MYIVFLKIFPIFVSGFYSGIVLNCGYSFSTVTVVNNGLCVISKKIVDVRLLKFQDIYDFFAKMSKEQIPKNIYLSLINSGTLDSLNINRKTLVQNFDNLINYKK